MVYLNNNIYMAISKQQIETYGLKRSPITAALRKKPPKLKKIHLISFYCIFK